MRRFIDPVFIAFAVAAALALYALNAPANAESLIILPTGNGGMMILRGDNGPTVRTITVPRDETDEAQERNRKWESFCKPTGNVDAYGVTRFSYKHEGCEFGRDQ